MTLRIYPAVTPYDEIYQLLVDSVPEGSQWLRAPIVLPYSYNTTDFIVESGVGDTVDVYINNNLVKTFTTTLNSTQISLQLEQGRNFIQVVTSTETYLILVAATYWAIYLRAWAREYYYHAGVRVEDAERQLTSFFSLRSVEHQIEFSDLLPPTRAERILAGKLAVKALINETGTTRGINEIVTAASNNTPVVIPTTVNTEFFDPSYDLYNTAQDFGGYEFNCWIPNLCVTIWASFLHLVNNLDYIDVLESSDIKAILEVGKTTAYIVSLGLANPTLFTGGETLNLKIDGKAFEVLFQSGDQTPSQIVDRINVYSGLANLPYQVAWVVGEEIKISSGKKGPASTIEITGGTALSYLGLTIQDKIGSDGTLETHTFDFESNSCNLPNLIFNSCFDKVRLYVSASVLGDIAFCLWQHPLEKIVELPLAAGIFDLGDTFDSGSTFDSGDPADPYGDGWVGTTITPELDTELVFDPFFDVKAYEDLECLWNGPVATPLEASLVETQINYGTINVHALLQITT